MLIHTKFLLSHSEGFKNQYENPAMVLFDHSGIVVRKMGFLFEAVLLYHINKFLF